MAQPPKKMKKDIKEQQVKSKININEEFSSDWDVDYYKTDYESEEHWELRRRFMVTHKDKFPEDTLVCLAQVFVNMEFMGCKYPSETMLRVAELSKEIAKEFRDQRSGRLKRTFVTASNAAEQRAKGRRTTTQQTEENKNKHLFASGKRKCFGTGEWGDQKLNKDINLFEDLPYGKYVLFFHFERDWVRLSAQRSGVQYKEVESGAATENKTVSIYLDNKFVAKSSNKTLKESKKDVSIAAIKALQNCCYTIKKNPLRDTIKIEKSNNEIVLRVTKEKIETITEEKKLDSNNLGYKMMKSMGWNGGGLGSKTQGREEPVSYLLKNNRDGLGNSAGRLDRLRLTQLLNNYTNSPDIRELQFEPTFTKDERAILHQIAAKLNLKSSSVAKGDDRRLIIEKKIFSPENILHEVLVKKNPSYSDRFFVQVPITKAAMFPEHTTSLQPDT